MNPTTRRLIIFVSALSLASGISAQTPSQNDSSSEQCSSNVQGIASDEIFFNSTGTGSFRAPTLEREGTDWYLSMLFRDVRGTSLEDRPPHQQLDVYLSVPESSQSFNATWSNSTSTICAYRLKGQNAVSDYPDPKEARISCSGILSDECHQEIGDFPLPGSDGCSRPPTIRSECGGDPSFRSSYPIKTGNSTCTLSELPHVNLPEDYRSISLQLGGNFSPILDGTDETYDKRVRERIPIVITGRNYEDDTRGWRRFLCLAPEDVVEGSREPEGDFPDGTGRIGVQSWFALVPALVMAVIMK